LWVKRYTSPGKGFDVARSVAVSPSGKTVFVTGQSAGAATGEDYTTVAYDAATGAQLWASHYSGPGNGTDEAHSVAVSPSGRTVFVTGTSPGATSEHDYATVAYSAATGAQLWVKRYNGPGNNYDDAAAVTVSPTGRRVFVTGQSAGATSGSDYATVAYSAATGAQLWVSRYNGPGNGYDAATALAVSPGGHTVFVTGSSNRLTSGGDYGSDYATVAYSAATGAQLWVKRYNGPANDYDAAAALALSPGGGTVVVTGASAGATSLDYATVAYRTRTGARLWVKRYNGPGNDLDGAESVALSPGGGTVVVTGTSIGAGSLFDYATLAYRTRTGARLWVARYNGPGNGFDVARSVAVSPNGKTVYVTGGSDGATSRRDYTTVAYNAATGTLVWLQRYNGPGNNWDFAFSMAVSPAGRRVFITGESVGATTHWDYATVAYRG
jgi:WD40 repeat protein